MDEVRVLLVDDEQDIVDTISYSLELRGCQVRVAYDGIAAVRAARSGHCDLMILDVMLPGKNGYEVSRELKEDMDAGVIPRFPIILLTARKLDNDMREEFVSTWSRADACIYKPFDMDDLTRQMDKLLSRVGS